jgi:hypothetical protein
MEVKASDVLAWVRRQRKLSQVLAAGFHHVTARSRFGARFETYELFISLIFQFFRAAVNHG